MYIMSPKTQSGLLYPRKCAQVPSVIKLEHECEAEAIISSLCREQLDNIRLTKLIRNYT